MANIHERFEINVAAQEVYEALLDPERIVRSLPGVSSMYRFEDDHYRVDVGEAGRNVELDLLISERVPPRHIAWQSSDGRWSGSVDVESLAEHRALVIVQVVDRHAPTGEADTADNAVTIDAALRALKQSLEAAASDEAQPEAGDDIHIGHRAGAGSANTREKRDEASSGDDRWRGGRGFFRGSDQAMAMMRSLSREMDRLWEQVMRRATTAGRTPGNFMGGFTPAIEMCELDDEVRIRAEVPGVEPHDLHVEVDPEMVVIRGERRSDSPAGQPARSERAYGNFVRRIPIPAGLRTDDARARLRNGVLDLRIPLARLRRGREVPVETTDTEH